MLRKRVGTLLNFFRSYSGGSDLVIFVFQLTTKAMGRDPLRHRAPHFLCGSLTEEDSTLIMYTPLPDVPLLFKNLSNQEKKVKIEMNGDQPSNQQALGELSFAFISFSSYKEL